VRAEPPLGCGGVPPAVDNLVRGSVLVTPPPALAPAGVAVDAGGVECAVRNLRTARRR
jgi:hypothetical protein